jgi:Mg-chelatase subunit ChlD
MRPNLASLATAAALLAFASGTGAAGPQGVVFAVDTSRSLHADELAQVTSLLADAVGQLQAGTRAGLLAFDNAPRWVVPLGGSRADVQRELSGLSPSGDYTLLHDALFTAARALPDGGVIVLATDGRDENSATTVEDVAGLCRTNRVRIVAVGAGRNIDDRGLRRLALLTNGNYLGPMGEGLAGTLNRAVRQASEAVAGEAASAQPAAPPAPAQVAPGARFS